MTVRQRYDGIVAWFSDTCPRPKANCATKDPYQLLVAVILSAQCTDKRVNMTTPALFEAFRPRSRWRRPRPKRFIPTSGAFPIPTTRRRTSRRWRGCSARSSAAKSRPIWSRCSGCPAWAARRPNVLGAVLWQKEVMPVDTHVFRVSERIGLTTGSKTPLQTELTLEKHIPGHLLPVAHHWLILHGRYVCTARAPGSAASAASARGAGSTPPTAGRSGRSGMGSSPLNGAPCGFAA